MSAGPEPPLSCDLRLNHAPIPGLLAEFVVLGLQAVDQGAQLSHFRAQVLHRGGQPGQKLGLLLPC